MWSSRFNAFCDELLLNMVVKSGYFARNQSPLTAFSLYKVFSPEDLLFTGYFPVFCTTVSTLETVAVKIPGDRQLLKYPKHTSVFHHSGIRCELYPMLLSRICMILCTVLLPWLYDCNNCIAGVSRHADVPTEVAGVQITRLKTRVS